MTASYFPLQKISEEIPLIPNIRFYGVRRAFLLSLFLLLVFQSSIFAQNKYDFPQFGRETGTFFTRPLHWDGGDWLKLGVMSAGTFLLIKVADQPVRDLMLKNRSYENTVPVVAGRMWGDLYTPVVLFAGFAAHSLITDDISTRKIAYEIGQASLYAGAITYVLKTAFGRARPYENEGANSYHPFSLSNDFHSFPGGHTTVAFILSTVLSRNAGPTWLKILAYVPAVITPVSRIYEDQHWVSSCFFGAAMGYLIATWVVDHHEQEDNRVAIGMSPGYPLTVRIIIN